MSQLPQTNPDNIMVINKPIFSKMLSLDIMKRYMYNEIYAPIYVILSDGPKTISEIHKEYNQRNLMNEKSDDKKKKKEKTENTVYKYVKKLVSEGIVIEYGRVADLTESSTTVKILYQNSALFFLPNNYVSETLKNTYGELVSEIVGIFLSRHFENKFASNQNLIDYFSRTYDHFYEEFMYIFNKLQIEFEKTSSKDNYLQNPFFKFFQKLSFSSYMMVIDNLRTIITINQVVNDKKILEDLSKLFTNPKNEKLIDSTSFLKIPGDSENERVIIKKDFEQPSAKPVLSADWEKYFTDINYTAIFDLLKRDIMTVKDIHAKHFETVKHLILKQEKNCDLYGYDKYETCQFTSDEMPEPKTENTIYRYLRELIKAGYIIEAGRLIIPDKLATQILYTRSAKLFIYNEEQTEFWDTEQGILATECLCKLLAVYFGKEDRKESETKNLIKSLSENFYNSLNSAYEEVTHNSVIEPIRHFEKTEFASVMELLTTFEYLLTNDEDKFISELKNSFDK